MPKLDKSAFAQAARMISDWKRPLLVAHAKPDGDALGSLAAMRALLEGRGAAPTALLFDPLPVRYSPFQRMPSMPRLGADFSIDELDRHDGLILLDTCSYSQLAPIADWIRGAKLPKLAVDHHATRDEMVDTYLVDVDAAATCLILHDWAMAMDWPIEHATAEALYVGIATDTGWFRHSNTDERVFRAAADLIDCGVKPNDLFQELHQCDSSARVRLLAAALGSLEMLHGDRTAVMTVMTADFARVGAKPSDTEDIINEPLRIGSVLVSILLVEQSAGPVRVSLRSRAPMPGNAIDIDVATIAAGLGGGGHKRAAGVRINGSPVEVRRRVVDAVADVLAQTG